MSRQALLGGLFISVAITSGCVTSPAPDTGGASAYSVGDRGRASFDEVVVSVRMTESKAAYQNLHISLAAFVNPLRKTAASPFDAQLILQRCESRVAARITQAFAGAGVKSIEDTLALQEIARAAGKAVAEETMQKWEHGADYEVQVAVTSFYWTDASVGRQPPRKNLNFF